MPSKQIKLPEGYKPSDDEEYMCAEHLEYFRQKLMDWRNSLIDESQENHQTISEARCGNVGDEAERASRETEKQPGTAYPRPLPQVAGQD